MASKCSFQINWLQEPQFAQWLERSSDTYSAKCKLCLKTFSLSNMGRRAVTSHMNSSKHKKHQSASVKSTSIRIFTTASGSISMDKNVNDKNLTRDESNLSSSTDAPQFFEQSAMVVSSSQTQLVTRVGQAEPKGLKAMIMKDEVTKAEILWCLQTVITHKSMRSAGKDVQLMTRMFPDSEIAKKMQLQKDKIGYTLAFGVAPFFKKSLINDLFGSEFIVIGFDESLNKVSQKNQMDVNVRYWDAAANEVKCRYLTSVFLGRSTAHDLLLAFREATDAVDTKKIIQISMDGPNVNIKFLKDLKESMIEEPEDRTLLDIGSCGLHTMHCAFKAAMNATGWNIVSFLRALYNLLKDCPARRAIYLSTTNSSLFPRKFCSVRWLDNANVADRALQMLPSLKLYINEMKRTGEVNSQSFATVARFVNDPFLPPKLEFFKSLASDLEPYLREFQSDQPLSPFLYDKLNAVIKTQMEKIVLSSVMKEKSAIKDIELKKENLMPPKAIVLGIGIKSALRSMHKQSDLSIITFRQDCRSGLIKFVEKMLDRSPIKFKLTKFISCLSPNVAAETKLSHGRMENLLTTLLETKWISTLEADQAQRSFHRITQDEGIIQELKKFKLIEDRLDHFWIKILERQPEKCSSLVKVVKLVATLSHGNANVERGFSVNRECLVENMHEEMLVAQRTVFDHVVSAGGMEKIVITKPLINAARNSYQVFKESVQKKKETQNELNTNKIKKRVAEKELKELEEKRAKLLKDAQETAALITEEISELKKKL